MLSYPNFAFRVTAQHAGARTGVLTTPHGAIETPNYIFCATKASIKGLAPDQVRAAGADIILGNAYHLMLQPGPGVIARAGGLHRFMGWSGPLLTDSGGFQVFSMGHGGVADEVKGRGSGPKRRSLLSVTEEGAAFRAYTDGREVLLTPEGSMDIQRALGADLVMQFDECPAYHAGRDYTAHSTHLSARWGERSLARFAAHDDGRQALYGIIQGGVHEDLRRASAGWVARRPFFGTAIGGCLGGSDAEMGAVIGWAMVHAPPERPVHLLGIGRVRDIFAFVRMGVDTFDCVIPTRLARHGAALMKGQAPLTLTAARFRDDHAPLDADSPYSRAYIHHLLRARETLAGQILTAHNIAVMAHLMREVRAGVQAGDLDAVERAWLAGAAPG
ncbi:MAG: tRNA guanosine(34) transglycosylase Tgt [Alphaproteobacteria bacterium]|jgi:queuine tRNA-ribosyltransferase|nr:tRNA guanosine(34) transglycosylase Tgt [Alphaproteobacteria bacterium]